MGKSQQMQPYVVFVVVVIFRECEEKMLDANSPNPNVQLQQYNNLNQQ